jgi:hypothetical protein
MSGRALMIVVLAWLAGQGTLMAQQAVTGRNVTIVQYETGVFRAIGVRQWVEDGTNGASFTFAEEKRDDTSVTLYDASRRYRVILDLRQKQILIDTTGSEFRPFYTISRVAAGAPLPAPRVLDARQQSGPIAYFVSQKSPLLTAAARGAISQDYNGAPLSGRPAVHTVTAERVYCRALNRRPEGAEARCTITYRAGAEASLTGEEARDLYIALSRAGVEDDGETGHINKTVTNLTCTVNDQVSQSAPGNQPYAGFACRFTTQ